MTASHLQEETNLAYRLFSINQWCTILDVDIVNTLKRLLIQYRRKVIRAPDPTHIKDNLVPFENVYTLNYQDVEFIWPYSNVETITFESVGLQYKTSIYYQQDGDIDYFAYYYSVKIKYLSEPIDQRLIFWDKRLLLSSDQNTQEYDSYNCNDHRHYQSLIFIEK